MSRQTIPIRTEQDAAHCWAITDIYPSDAAWEQELEACGSLPGEIGGYAGSLGKSAQTLLQYLTRMEEINLQTEKLYVYAMLRSDEDTANNYYRSMKGRCYSFLVQLSSAGAFEGPELIAIDEAVLERFYKEEPALEKYRRYLTKARLNRAHILSPAEETLLAGAGEVGAAPGNIFHAFLDADMAFPHVADGNGHSHPLTNGTYISLMESSDRTLRRNAFDSFYQVYKSMENTLASAYNAELRKNVFFSNARKFETVLESALFPNEVPVAVYHNLIRAVRENLPKLHRYMALRKKVMGLDELHMYDIYANMLPEAGQVIPFEQAAADVLSSTSVLGKAYTEVLERSFRERWIDIYENKGKRSGAYSCGCPTVHPFVLLNHKDNLNSAFTLAHELGHAMHSWLSEQKQPYLYSDYVLFVAEVASTCNEALLMAYLLEKTTDKRQRAVLLNYFLEQFRTTLYRQTMFAEFELEAHKRAEAGETLTAEILNKLYYELNLDYYGDAVKVDEAICVEWARIPHFYRHFYVYQYATGFSAAIALSDRILKEGEPAAANYLEFLSGGCTKDPVSLLKIAGVDMSIPDPVNAALERFGSLLDELDQLLQE